MQPPDDGSAAVRLKAGPVTAGRIKPGPAATAPARHEPGGEVPEQETVLSLAARQPGGFDVAVAVGARLDVEGLADLALVSKFFAVLLPDRG